MLPMKEEDDHGFVEEERCPICYETFFKRDLDGGVGAETRPRHEREALPVDGCQHKFCRDCLTNHCKYAVSNREIPIGCPASASDKCENILDQEQIQELLCSIEAAESGSITTDWTRYRRIQKLQQDPSLTTCARCDEIVSKDKNLAQGGHDNELACNACGHKFCAIHGDAHPGRSCEDYKSHSAGRQMRKSEKMIQRMTKPCSHCGVPIEKESGCDHVICVSCKKDMCYKCGTHTHLKGDGMIRSCQKCNQSFVDHRYIWSYRLVVFISLPVYIPLCIIYTCVAGAVAILTFGCCCCFECGAEDLPDGGKTYSPMRGVAKLLVAVFLPFFDLLREFGLEFREPEKFPRSPSTETTHIEEHVDSSSSDCEEVGSAV